MDQPLFALVVKGFGRRALLPSPPGRAGRSAGAPLLQPCLRMSPCFTRRWLAKPGELWPVSWRNGFAGEEYMKRVTAVLVGVSALLSVVLGGVGPAAADDNDARNYFGTGMGSIFGGGGGS